MASSTQSQALEQFNTGQYLEAASLASRALADDPVCGVSWQLRGTALWRQQLFEAACADLEQATCLTPLAPLAQIALADCYVRLGHVEPAVAIYEHLLAWPATPRAFLPHMARALGRLEEWELAWETCSRLAEQEPHNHAAHFGMAYYLHRMGAALEELVPALQTAFHLKPGALTYRLNLALALTALDRREQADALVRPLVIAECRCLCQLRILQSIHHQLGNAGALRACERRLRQLMSASDRKSI